MKRWRPTVSSNPVHDLVTTFVNGQNNRCCPELLDPKQVPPASRSVIWYFKLSRRRAIGRSCRWVPPFQVQANFPGQSWRGTWEAAPDIWILGAPSKACLPEASTFGGRSRSDI